MADEDGVRDQRARELAVEAADRARRLAFEQGQREANVDAILKSHDERFSRNDARFAAINGSIDRGVTSTRDLVVSVEALRDDVAKLAAIQQTKEAVDRALHAEVKTANESQISTRAWRLGIATIVLMFLGLIISILVALPSLAGHP